MVQTAAGFEPPGRFLLASSPSEHNVYIAAFPDSHEFAKPPDQRTLVKAQVLIDGQASKCIGTGCTEDSDMGLQSPEGLALHHGSDKAVLYVADPPAQNVYSYHIMGSQGLISADSVKVGAQRRVLEGLVGVQDVAVDGFGNLYYTTNQGEVGTVPADELEWSKPTQRILYSTSSDSTTVSSPFGLAADAFFVYWTNQEAGQTAGTVVRAMEKNSNELRQQYPEYPQQLAQNGEKAYGVCLVNDNVFFTAEGQFLYGVKKSGGSVSEVYHNFKKPRGCSHDGQNSVVVADLEDSAVYMLPANLAQLRSIKTARKVFEVPSPASLAVFTSSSRYGEERDDKGFLGMGW